MIYRCVAMFVLPDADFADDADERRSLIVLKENKSAFLCVICARLRPVNTSKRTHKSSFAIVYYNPNAGTKSSSCLSVMPAGSYPAMRALK